MKKIVLVLGLLISLAFTSEVNAEENQEKINSSNITNSIQLRLEYRYSKLFNSQPPAKVYLPEYFPHPIYLVGVAYIGGGKYIGYYN